jgi:hypothetical protein
MARNIRNTNTSGGLMASRREMIPAVNIVI